MTQVQTAAFTSPSDTTAVAATPTFRNLDRFSSFIIDAVLTGATGGTLDIYLQRAVGDDWVDWYRFAQVAGSAAAIRRTITSDMVTLTAPLTVGANASVGIAANTLGARHPGSAVRIWQVPGAGTSAGAAQSIKLTCIE